MAYSEINEIKIYDSTDDSIIATIDTSGINIERETINCIVTEDGMQYCISDIPIVTVDNAGLITIKDTSGNILLTLNAATGLTRVKEDTNCNTILQSRSGPSYSPMLYFKKSSNDAGADADITSTDMIMDVRCLGYYNAGWQNMGGWYLQADGTPTTNGTPSKLVFRTASASGYQDVLKIDSAKLATFYGPVKSTQFFLSALNTAPANAGATGTAGEIRFTSTAIFLCTQTNTWVKCALATW